MLTFLKIDKRLSDRQKTITLLKKNVKLNDIIGAKRYNIYFVHQRVADLRKEGWVIKSHLNEDGKLDFYELISEPANVAAI